MAISTFGSTLSDRELWRYAQYQIDTHGQFEAVIDINRRIYAMGEAGDRNSANTWMAITLRILHLGDKGRGTTHQ